jgi:hypothetical protein
VKRRRDRVDLKKAVMNPKKGMNRSRSFILGAPATVVERRSVEAYPDRWKRLPQRKHLACRASAHL